MFFKLLNFLFGRSGSSSKWGEATPAQIEYLENLIEINNAYRATPWTLNDWVKTFYKGSLYFWSAKKLIEKIKSENLMKQKNFKEKIKNRVDRKTKDTIFASDFSAYGFCPNSFYLGHRGFASINLYEMTSGKLYHGDFAKSDVYSNKNSDFLEKNIKGIENIKWYKSDEAEALYDSKLKLSGIPDGLLSFEDKTQSIVEVKSKNSFKNIGPYWGEILQAIAYHKIFSNNRKSDSYNLNDKIFFLYILRKTQERRLFEISASQYSSSFRSALEKIKNVSFDKTLFNSEKNNKKCPTCGYRSLCKDFKTG